MHNFLCLALAWLGLSWVLFIGKKNIHGDLSGGK
jgi:hypothetical protein